MALRPANFRPVARQHRTIIAALLLAATGLLSGCSGMSFLITPVPTSQALVEKALIRESPWATRKIAVLHVDGVISNARERSLTGGQGENPVALFKEQLDQAEADAAVRAVVLRINSPGGGVTASDLMYQELRGFRERTGKPVIASFLDLGTSGAYYLACAADKIVAQPTSVTGSIGVIMLTPDLSGTMGKLGLRMNVIKSGPLKDAGSPFREMAAEDRAVFEELVSQMYERFVQIVAQARPALAEPRVRELADGRVYLAPEALAAGLIDEVGGLPEALTLAKKAAGLAQQRVLVVRYDRPLLHRPNVYAEPAPLRPQVNLINVDVSQWSLLPTPQFMYLWAPAPGS